MFASASSNDGPLGKAPDIGVGASDKLLVAVSLVGFVFLAYTIYSIIITKVKSSEELEEEEIDYDDRLAQADVATLTRAQRRARARHIAKQQRRVAPNDALPEDQPEEQEVPAMEEDTHHAGNLRHLSRKERQKAAKEIEIKERNMLQDQRRKEQLEAQEEARIKKRDKEKQQALQADIDRKNRQEQREADEQAAYQKWRTFLPADNSITVKEWIQELQKDPIVDVRALADRFGVSTHEALKRIGELLEADRVTGFVTERGDKFVYLSPGNMEALASVLLAKDKFTDSDVQEELTKLIESKNLNL